MIADCKDSAVFTSQYKVPQNVDDLVLALPLNRSTAGAYVQFLKQYNVVLFNTEPYIDYCISCDGELLPLEVLFGFSQVDAEDVLATNDMYEYRIPEDYCAIASINYGDLLCLSPQGEVLYWNHEVHDLYLDMTVKAGYLEQNTDLSFVAESFDTFMSMITKTVVEDD